MNRGNLVHPAEDQKCTPLPGRRSQYRTTSPSGSVVKRASPHRRHLNASNLRAADLIAGSEASGNAVERRSAEGQRFPIVRHDNNDSRLQSIPKTRRGDPVSTASQASYRSAQHFAAACFGASHRIPQQPYQPQMKPDSRMSLFGSKLLRGTKRMISLRSSSTASNASRTVSHSNETMIHNNTFRSSVNEYRKSPCPLLPPPDSSPYFMHHIRDPSSEVSSLPKMSDVEHLPTIAIPKVTLRSFAAPRVRRLRPKLEVLYLVVDIDCAPYSAAAADEDTGRQQHEAGELNDLVVSLVCPNGLSEPTAVGPTRCSRLHCYDIWTIVWCFEPQEISVLKTAKSKQVLRPATVQGRLSRLTPNHDPESLWGSQEYVDDADRLEELNLHIDFRHDRFPPNILLGMDHSFRLTGIPRVDNRVYAHTSLMTRQYSHRPDHMNARKTWDLCYLAHSVIRMLQGGCETADVPMFLTPSPDMDTEKARRVLSDFLSVSSRFLAPALLRELEMLKDRFDTVAAASKPAHASISLKKRPKAGPISKFLPGNRGYTSQLASSSVPKQAENNRVASSRPAVQIDRHDVGIEQLLRDVTNLNLGPIAEQRAFKHEPAATEDVLDTFPTKEDVPVPLFSPRKRPCIRKTEHECSNRQGSPKKSHRTTARYGVKVDQRLGQKSGYSDESLMAAWDALAAAPDLAPQPCTPTRNISEGSGHTMSDDDEERLAEARVMGSPWM